MLVAAGCGGATSSDTSANSSTRVAQTADTPPSADGASSTEATTTNGTTTVDNTPTTKVVTKTATTTKTDSTTSTTKTDTTSGASKSSTDTTSGTTSGSTTTAANSTGGTQTSPTPSQPQQQPPATNPTSSTSSTSSTAFLDRIDTRAMWVWSESPSSQQILENTGGAQDTLLQFAAAPHGDASRKLNRLFFEARGHSNVDRFSQIRPVTYDPLKDAGPQANLRAFLKRAHAQGTAVEYLDGQAIWVTTDANADVPKQICRDVVAFNKTASSASERLDGVHFDIEPHTIHSGPWSGGWWQNRLPNGYNADWTQRWEDIMDSCRATFDAYEAQSGQHLVLAGDVGTDYAYYNKPILEFFNGPNSPIDYIGIMNYFDNRPNVNGQPSFFYGDNDGSNMTGGVEQNLSLWNNTPVLFGLETGPTSIAPDAASFAQEGYKALNATVDTLVSNYKGTNTIGVAIHHYSPGSYKDLQP